MSVGARIAVSLRQPKVYDIHRVMMTAQTDQKIVRLDVPMDEALHGNSTKAGRREGLDILLNKKILFVLLPTKKSSLHAPKMQGIT